MAMVVNNNIPALQTYNTINRTNNALNKSIQKLSTGLRINSAADDAAGLAISEKMRSQISGMDRAVSNAQDGISMIQTAEGALNETHSILQRMRELAVQASNDTLTSQDRGYIQMEIDQLREEVTRIGNTTQFNKKKLLNGDAAVLWSSDNLETKAVINGGLRTIDQFGQKSSAEGNYRVNVKALPGQGEVQKSDIFKIKHDIDFDVVGTGMFQGAKVEGEATSGVGARGIKIAVTGAMVDDGSGTLTATDGELEVVFNGEVADVAAALKKALARDGGETEYTDGMKVVTNTIKENNIAVTVDGAGIDFSVSSTQGGEIAIDASTDGDIIDASNDNLSKILGATDDTTLNGQTYVQTIQLADVAANALTDATNYSMGKISVAADGTPIEVAGDFVIGTGAQLNDKTANEIAQIAAEKIQAQINTSDALKAVLSVEADGDTLKFTSKAGKLTIEDGGTNNQKFFATAMGGNVDPSNDLVTESVTYTNALGAADKVNATNVGDTNLVKDNFAMNLVGKKVTIGGQAITIGGDETTTLGATKKTNDAASPAVTTTATGEEVIDDIVAQATTTLADAFKDAGITIEKVDGKLKITSLEKLEISADDEGVLNALFGFDTDQTDPKDATKTIVDIDPDDATFTSMTVEVQDDALTLKNVLPLGRDYSFVINDEETGEEIAAISISGPYEDADGNPSAQAAVDKINDALKTAGVGGDGKGEFQAILTTDSDGNEKIAIYSKYRDFELADGEDVDNSTKYGFQDLFGNGTATKSGAEQNQLDEISTVGEIGNSRTSLRDLEKFWDSQGVFMLNEPQTITVTQGDGKQATFTLYETDTLGSMAEKINNAIANGLGQAKYLDSTDANYADALNKFATFVDEANASGLGEESVQGTMLIRTLVPGQSGSISFSGDENILNALSLNTLPGKSASESQYVVNITDAHTGATVVKDAKVTGNRLVGALHPNVDVVFDATSGFKASWVTDDDGNGSFVLTPDADGTTTTLHLTDNTTVFQIGANEGEDMGINIGDMRAEALGLNRVLVTDRASASHSITLIDNAIDKVSTQRAKLGAYQNRLEHTINNLSTASENITAAESRIRDTDMAKEMMNFTKLQIMLQAGTSMLAQANQLPQNVLSLVR